MKNSLHYKGYMGTVAFSEEDGVFHGRVSGVKASIFFAGDSVESLTEDFHDAVDEYLKHCVENGVEPERPYKGSFNVRIGAELHRKAAEHASEQGVSLNSFVEEAIRHYVE